MAGALRIERRLKLSIAAVLMAAYKTSMSSADPQTIIRAKEAEIAARRRELELMEAELRGMRAVFAHVLPGKPTTHHLRPMSIETARASIGQPHLAPTAGYRGGRQPGAISTPWRHILSDAYHEAGDAGFSENRIVGIAADNGISLKPSDARNRMLAYLPHRYVEENPDISGVWRVTEYAAKKFGFFNKRLEKNEAPDANAQEPPESLGPGDQTGAD
jgi:hypothetical protein